MLHMRTRYRPSRRARASMSSLRARAGIGSQRARPGMSSLRTDDGMSSLCASTGSLLHAITGNHCSFTDSRLALEQ